MAVTTATRRTPLQVILQSNLGAPILLLALLGMMILPVPPFLLDVLFSFNIALAIVVLLVAAYALRPLDFAVFPTILLIATLLRLALNVASTRVVLLEGHKGGDAAGKVIQSFGEVVIGGNYAVGLVVFLILMIINFVVVTKGAGRISEVSARFTLDAMPGKQMAIDADLNSGLITQDEARTRREEVGGEADFYGSMDGASKFVRGDAVAGMLILAINILGGLGIGMVQHDLEFGQAMQVYSLLTIGDGLVAQIPSLLLSTTAAIMVTRVNSSKDMGEQVMSQMFESPKALSVAAVILAFMGLIPGMPHFAFLTLAAMAGGMAWYINKNGDEKIEQAQQVERGQLEQQEVAAKQAAELPELGWDDVHPVDAIGLEVGYRLIPLVDKSQGGELLNRIKGIRKKLSQEVGFLIPSVHIRDNLELLPNAYRITLLGVTAGEAEIYPDRDLAINPGQVFGKLDGVPTTDPAFGLEAVWIDPASKDQAQTLGYTVVDASTVVATHINQLLQKHTHELLGHDEVQQMLDKLAKNSPKLAEELPSVVPLNMLLTVLKNLLAEQVPIRDLRTIAEALAASGSQSQDSAALTASARVALRRVIVQAIYGRDGLLPVIALDPAMEQLLLKSLQQSQQAGNGDDIVLEPGLAERLQQALQESAQQQEMAGKPSVLLVSAPLRAVMAKFIRYSAADMQVLSYAEIPDDKQVTIESTIG
ncbi:flagellar biosynthesis protein FlhA [Dasania marina]|uniref:flagellar biosynthesis protein FlhA n=1 Tax=Dasania marina TaxID=471499 RepID=UPI00036427C2|nr:flagellar biosynthesis protein FlhA [Dasania marina]